MEKILFWLFKRGKVPQEMQIVPQKMDEGDTQYRILPVDKGWYTKIFLQFKQGKKLYQKL